MWFIERYFKKQNSIILEGIAVSVADRWKLELRLKRYLHDLCNAFMSTTHAWSCAFGVQLILAWDCVLQCQGSFQSLVNDKCDPYRVTIWHWHTPMLLMWSSITKQLCQISLQRLVIYHLIKLF